MRHFERREEANEFSINELFVFETTTTYRLKYSGVENDGDRYRR